MPAQHPRGGAPVGRKSWGRGGARLIRKNSLNLQRVSFRRKPRRRGLMWYWQVKGGEPLKKRGWRAQKIKKKKNYGRASQFRELSKKLPPNQGPRETYPPFGLGKKKRISGTEDKFRFGPVIRKSGPLVCV